jgi:DNA polymerase-3 subunit gamma/tau
MNTLSAHLVRVAESEGRTLHPDAAHLIASHGKGSYRDALGVLEQILAVSGKEIEHEKVRTLLGAPEKDSVVSLLEAICKKDAKTALSCIRKLSHLNALRTYDDLVELVRQGLLVRVGEGNTENKELTRLAAEYPLVIGSKLILELLQKRHLLEVSESHSWIALEAILLSVIEA